MEQEGEGVVSSKRKNLFNSIMDAESQDVNIVPPVQEKSKAKSVKASSKQAVLVVKTKPKQIIKKQVEQANRIVQQTNEGSLLFSLLTQVYESVGNTKGQNSKLFQRKVLKDLFQKLCRRNPQDLIKAFWLSVIKIGPDYVKNELGVGNETLYQAISIATGQTSQVIRSSLQAMGDLGDVAEKLKNSQKTITSYFTNKTKASPLTINKVFNTFLAISKCKGNNSSAEKTNKIVELLRESKNEETKFIIRWIQGNLKINAGQKTMQTALIEALFEIYFQGGNEEDLQTYSSHIKKAIAEYPNEADVIRKLVQIKQKIELLQQTCKISIGVPCKPMLAKPTKSVASILTRFQGKQFTCQYKYDGLRGQIHYNDGKIEIFSRNLQNMTEAYPDIQQSILKSITLEENSEDTPISSFIIDSEIVAINRNTKQLLPFQTLSTRSRKNAQLNEIEVYVSVFTFDILFLNGKPLTHLTLKQRRQKLKKILVRMEARMVQQKLQPITTLISSKQCDNISEIDGFLQEAITKGTEGLMIKDLGTIYSCAKRSWDWVKLKKDYIDGLGDTLDVVPIGALNGVGKRTGLFGSYLLAIFNPDLERYETLCKIGTGFSDEVLQAAFNFFKDKITNVCPRQYNVSDKDKVDVWFTPSTVWEVKGADFQLSPVYTCGKGTVDGNCGIGLRFPRLIRIRDDKKPNQGSDTSFVIDLYKQQAVVQNKNNQADEEDDDYY